MTELTIPARFRGPTRSGNGGWTAGSVAAHVGRAHPVIEVSLRLPPPLDTPLTLADQSDPKGGVTVLLDPSGARVAEARSVEADLMPVDVVPADVAATAMHDYPGLRSHPFPECFACGPDRDPDDGLNIFPGPVPGRPDTVASLWVPHPSLAEPADLEAMDGIEHVGTATTWAALDCVGGWSEDLEGRPCVLGRMAARVDALPVVGEPHVVVGHKRGVDGRKTFTASTLYDGDGRVVATAEHVWIAVDPAAFNALNSR